jgi:ubiquinone/menaquinone biosynthesis C-methylase UbiE
VTAPYQINERAFQEVCEDLQRLPGFKVSEPGWRLRRFEICSIAGKLPPGGTLLDVGSGPGFVPRYFHKVGQKVISMDFPGTGGLDALKVLMDIGIQGHYVQVGVETLPLPDDSIDVVFVGNVIEHLPNSPKRFMADLKRVIKPGGYLIMDTKNAVDLKTRLKVLAGVSNWAPLNSFYDYEINPHHHKEYTLAELARLFELNEFRNIERITEEFFFLLSLKKFKTLQAMGAKAGESSQFGSGFNPWHPYEYLRMLLLLITKIVPSLRSEIMVIGQK